MKNFKEIINYNIKEDVVIKDDCKYDNNIYTFDIETTSFFKYKNKIYNINEYTKFNDEEVKFGSTMYIWQFSINKDVFYGRTWIDLLYFLKKLNEKISVVKIVFVHNLSFEFHFLKSILEFTDVFCRAPHKVMKCYNSTFKLQFRCSYFLSNSSLDKLAQNYNLSVKKLVGNLDYNKIRHFKTILSNEEMEYCENDCLVVYEFIKFMMYNKNIYEIVNLPLTSTGFVRREFKESIIDLKKYKNEVQKSINTSGHVYNLMIEAFAGGYTHANFMYTDEILHDVDSYDFTSSYPYVMLTEKYPMSKFHKCNISDLSKLLPFFAYILVIKFYNIKSILYNNFLSFSKCRNIRGGRYDNGRIIEASELEITLTDVDLQYLLKSYKFEKYEILESQYSRYKYLPKDFRKFILKKYNEKTKLKDIEGKESQYALSKALVNSLFGMSVTNNIRDEVLYKNGNFEIVPLKNEDIEEKLLKEYWKGFLSFSWRYLDYRLC